MAGGIIDVGTGAAQAIGRYFSIVSVVPSFLYVTFVYLLIASGSPGQSPDWHQAFASLGNLSIDGIAVLALSSIALGVVIHPIQFATVQFFEGYWGTGRLAQAFRSQRILHYQRLCDWLNRQEEAADDVLSGWAENSVPTSPGIRAPLRSRFDEAQRARTAFPADIEHTMPTRLGNVLRRAEAQAGLQYGIDALQAVPHLLMIAPASHVDYVNDQRSQLDLAVRMTLISAAATVTAVLFLWPYGLWALAALGPYAVAYLSYRGAVIAAGHYGAAIDTLVNLDRFTLYRELHLRLPASAAQERDANEALMALLSHDPWVDVDYEHPSTRTAEETGSGAGEGAGGNAVQE